MNNWEEIINRGWIAKIPQLQSSTTVDNNFCMKLYLLLSSYKILLSIFYVDRKRRRIDNDDSVSLIKLVRFCSSCHSSLPSKQTKKNEKTIPNPIGFIDSTQANDLLSCYL